MTSKFNILIVEDDLLIAEMLKEMLLDLSYNVVKITKNYTQAVNELSVNNSIDLVFLDINLSDSKTGVDIAHQINNNSKVPFIYLTSYSDPKSIIEASATLPEA
jgi:two-component SAPR family response regulator